MIYSCKRGKNLPNVNEMTFLSEFNEIQIHFNFNLKLNP